MNLLTRFKHRLSSCLFPLAETGAEEAYDLWSLKYDDQPDNLMLALDEAMFSELIAKIDFYNKVIADIGCGTGRHWKEIYTKQPAQLIGYDVSEGMLKVLKERFPHAQCYQLKANHLAELKDNSCDVIISTLAMAHIKDIEEAFAEWARVLKRDGHIIITDYHPDALSKGGDRTFIYDGKLIAIKNYVHPVEKIREILSRLEFSMEEFAEKKIDESVKPYYEKRQAMKVYEQFKGTAIIYGAHLKRTNAAE